MRKTRGILGRIVAYIELFQIVFKPIAGLYDSGLLIADTFLDFFT